MQGQDGQVKMGQQKRDLVRNRTGQCVDLFRVCPLRETFLPLNEVNPSGSCFGSTSTDLAGASVNVASIDERKVLCRIGCV